MPPNISVIMVSYHTGPILMRAIEAVLQDNAATELILVDNGNPTPAQAWLDDIAKRNTRIAVLRGHGNIGFGAGCNLGAEKASGDYFVFLNPDTILHPGSLATLQSALNDHQDAWMAGPAVLTTKGTIHPTSVRNLLTPAVALSEALRLPRLTSLFPSMNRKVKEQITQPVPAISGACMMLTKKAWQMLGGFNQAYFLHVEDLDLCLRTHEHGGTILYVPEARITHLGSTSASSKEIVEGHKTDSFVRYFRRYALHHGSRLNAALVARLFRLRHLLRRTHLRIHDAKAMKRAAHEQELHQHKITHLTAATPPVNLPASAAPVLLTGTTGQVGIAVLNRLLASNINTHALFHDNLLAYEHPSLHWIYGNLAAQDGLSNLTNINATTLIHTAPLWLLPAHLGTIKALGITRIIAVSSTSAMTKEHSISKREQRLAQTLIDAETAVLDYCKSHNITCTILRPTLIYGYAMDQNIGAIVDWFRRYAILPLPYPADGKRQPLHVDDLADAMLGLLSCNTPQPLYTISGSNTLSYFDMASIVLKHARPEGSIARVPGFSLWLRAISLIFSSLENKAAIVARMNQDLVFDNHAIITDSKVTPRSFSEQELGAYTL